MRRTSYGLVILAVFSMLLFACGSSDDDDHKNVDGDYEETESSESSDSALVGLMVRGAVHKQFISNEDACIYPDAAGAEVFANGSFDIQVFQYSGNGYPLALSVMAEPLKDGVEGEVVLSSAEVSFTPPPSWTTSAIPGQNIELSGSIPIGGASIVELSILNEQIVSVLQSVFDGPSVDGKQWSGFAVNIEIVGFSPSGVELRAKYRFGLDICSGCVLQKEPASSICCYSEVDPEAYERIRNFRRLLSSFPDQDERCHLYYDRDSFIYCSWFEQCYFDELDCPSYTCNGR